MIDKIINPQNYGKSFCLWLLWLEYCFLNMWSDARQIQRNTASTKKKIKKSLFRNSINLCCSNILKCGAKDKFDHLCGDSFLNSSGSVQCALYRKNHKTLWEGKLIHYCEITYSVLCSEDAANKDSLKCCFKVYSVQWYTMIGIEVWK